MTNISYLFIACLEAHGVTHIFWVPGEENLDMLEAIRTSSLELIVTRNEQTAVFMAATHGRLTWKVGVALATLGPGATNMMTGIAYAQLGGMPVLVITGQKPVKKSKQGRFQVIDVVSMMKPITKFTTSLIDASRVATTIAHAIHTAEDEKPWAVHIELPEDIAREDAHGYTPFTFEKIRRPIPDDKAIAQLISSLETAKTPVLLIGAGANRKRITNYLTKVIKKYHLPFFTSQMGKGVVDERMPEYIWTAALTSGDYLHEAIKQADLIIAIGHDTIEKPTNLIELGKTKVVHINFTPAEMNELYHPDLQIIGDIGNTLRRLFEADINTSNRDLKPLVDAANHAKIQLSTTITEALSQWVITPARVAATLRKEINDDAIICLDNGLYKVRFARNFPCYHPNTLLLDNALATMWAGYSAAMTTKMLHPEKQVIAVVGDGGIMMNLGDLETAIRLWVDLTILVLNDNAYGMIKRKQHGMGLDDFGLDLQNPDFVKLAEAFWAKGYRVSTPDEFLPTFRKAEAEKWVKLIEVAFVYPEKVI
jgi:acetolactate synthase-1/2/3 large subunit